MDSSTTKTEAKLTQLTAELLAVPMSLPKLELPMATTTSITPSMLSTTINKLRRPMLKRRNSPKNSKRRSTTPRVSLHGSKRTSQNPKRPSNIISIKLIIKKPLSTTRKFITNTKSMPHTLFIRSLRNRKLKPTSTTRKNIMPRSTRATTPKKKERKLTITRRSQLLFKWTPPKWLRWMLRPTLHQMLVWMSLLAPTWPRIIHQTQPLILPKTQRLPSSRTEMSSYSANPTLTTDSAR